MQRLIKLTTFVQRLALARTLGHTLGRTRTRLSAALLALAILPQIALADLPSIEQPSNGGGGGSLYDNIQGYLADAAVLLGLILTTAGFLVVAGSALGKFREATKRGEWGEFATVVVVGVVLVVILIWLANKASDILA
ncbi:TIGR03745 family integrating conjugative element membrane protein [Salinisphaera aquimarina]|uniref:TIGR03745 family integrating conjugative element membrane protein n=1 Tax=Salinisphaera aquimarina TaxID=2094031 RepID=A0ABV7EV09_9GAMM